jgi:hypothetical protein
MSIDSICGPVPAGGETPAKAEHDSAERSKEQAASSSSLAGMLWFAGWLFTIGFAHLVWWKALLAVLLWPYFLGIEVRI